MQENIGKYRRTLAHKIDVQINFIENIENVFSFNRFFFISSDKRTYMTHMEKVGAIEASQCDVDEKMFKYFIEKHRLRLYRGATLTVSHMHLWIYTVMVCEIFCTILHTIL